MYEFVPTLPTYDLMYAFVTEMMTYLYITGALGVMGGASLGRHGHNVPEHRRATTRHRRLSAMTSHRAVPLRMPRFYRKIIPIVF